MKSALRIALGFLLFCFLINRSAVADGVAAQQLLAGLTFLPGPVNGARVESNGKALAIYGDPREKPPHADLVLLTSVRRDLVWPARQLIEDGAEAVIPESEAPNFLKPQDFWLRFQKARFHNYAQF